MLLQTHGRSSKYKKTVRTVKKCLNHIKIISLWFALKAIDLASKPTFKTLMLCHRHLRGWLNSWPFQDGQDQAENSKRRISLAGWAWHKPLKNVARKRLGHFTVSSQEEQIASALHDHSRDWPERGLCLPKGRLEWHGLVAQGGMWPAVTGARVAWEAALFTAGPLPLSFQPLPSHAALGAMMSSSAAGSGQLPWWVSLKKKYSAKSEI